MKGYRVEIPLSLFLAFVDWQFALGNICGYTFHRWCDNDWDIMGTNNAEGRMVNELPVVGHYLYGKSSMYGSIFRRWHRKWITHVPGISTIIRLIFAFYEPFIVGDYLGINFIGNGWWKFWLGFWVGLSQADGIHYALDKLYKD